MPKEFESCRKRGGRIRTMKPKGRRSSTYVHVCYDQSGKSHAGYVKHRKQ